MLEAVKTAKTLWSTNAVQTARVHANQNNTSNKTKLKSKTNKPFSKKLRNPE